MLSSLIAFAVLTAEQSPNALAETRIGCYRAVLLNGVTFIRDDSLVVLLRIGWVDSGWYRAGLDDLLPLLDRFMSAAADESYHEPAWQM